MKLLILCLASFAALSCTKTSPRLGDCEDYAYRAYGMCHQVCGGINEEDCFKVYLQDVDTCKHQYKQYTEYR